MSKNALFILILQLQSLTNGQLETCGINRIGYQNDKARLEIRIIKIEPMNAHTESAWKNQEIVAFENTTAIFDCISTYPIRWIMKYNFPHTQDWIEIEQRRYFGNFNNESTYCYSTRLTLNSFTKELIGKYTCQSENNEDLYSSFQLFMSEKENIAEPFYLQEGNTLQLTSNKMDYKLLIPCAVSHPSEKFYLQKINNVDSRTVKADFIPYAGFELMQNEGYSFAGNYRCVKRGQERNEKHSVLVKVSLVDYLYHPSFASIYGKEKFTVKCSSSSITKLEINESTGLKKYNITYTTDSSNIFPYTSILDFKFGKKSLQEGSVSCLQGNRIIKQWNFYQVDKQNGITVDYENNLIMCRAVNPYKLLSLSFKYCKSLELCQLYKTSMNKKDYKNVDTVQTTECGENCLHVQATSFTKAGGYIASCFFNKFSSLETFFIGLDNNIYSSLQQATNKSLVHLQAYDISMFWKSERNLVLECKWIPWIYTDFNVWIIEKRNGDLEILSNQINSTVEEKGIIISRLEYSYADNNIKSLRCSIGMRNSSQWVYSSHNFPLNGNEAESEICKSKESKETGQSLTPELMESNHVVSSTEDSTTNELIKALIFYVNIMSVILLIVLIVVVVNMCNNYSLSTNINNSFRQRNASSKEILCPKCDEIYSAIQENGNSCLAPNVQLPYPQIGQNYDISTARPMITDFNWKNNQEYLPERNSGNKIDAFALPENEEDFSSENESEFGNGVQYVQKLFHERKSETQIHNPKDWRSTQSNEINQQGSCPSLETKFNMRQKRKQELKSLYAKKRKTNKKDK